MGKRYELFCNGNLILVGCFDLKEFEKEVKELVEKLEREQHQVGAFIPVQKIVDPIEEEQKKGLNLHSTHCQVCRKLCKSVWLDAKIKKWVCEKCFNRSEEVKK